MSQFASAQSGGIHPNQRNVQHGQNIMPNGAWAGQSPVLYCSQDTNVSQVQTSTGTMVDITPSVNQHATSMHGVPLYYGGNQIPYQNPYQPQMMYDPNMYYQNNYFPQNPAGPMQHVPVQQQVPQQAQPLPPTKTRARRIIEIKNPSTNEVINKEVLQEEPPAGEQAKEQKRANIKAQFVQTFTQKVVEAEKKSAAAAISVEKPAVTDTAPSTPSTFVSSISTTPSPQKTSGSPSPQKFSPESSAPSITELESKVPDVPTPPSEPKESSPEIESPQKPTIIEPVKEVKKPKESVKEPVKEEVLEKPKDVYRPPIPKDREPERPNGVDLAENGADDDASRDASPDAYTKEDMVKLFKLQGEAVEIFKENEEEIANQCYNLKLIYFLRDVVKARRILPPCKVESLKEQGLHQESGPATAQRAKFGSGGPGVFNFAPNWVQGQGHVGKRVPYQGRHSDTHNRSNRKKGQTLSGRASTDRPNLRQPPPPPPDTLRKAENAWKPKRRENTAADEEARRYEISKAEIRSIFNKITPSTYEELSKEFLHLNVDSDAKLRSIAIDLIFDKAVEEPKFCQIYTDICKAQVEATGRGDNTFFRAIILKCQRTFEGSSDIGDRIIECRQRLEAATTDKEKSNVKEELELLEGKEKRFISYLYAAGMLVDSVVSTCVGKLYSIYIEQNKDEIYLQYAVELLMLVSKLYMSRNKEDKGESAVIQFMKWLPSVKNEVSTKIKVMIMNYEDMLKDNFKSQKDDKGPKTIAQIHEDVKKEEDRKRAERLQYDMKEKERNRGGHRQNNYGGRPSIDRVDKKDKRANAAMASQSVSSSAASRSRTSQSLRSVTGTTTLGRASGFFHQADQPKQTDGNNEGWQTVNRGGGAGGSRRESAERRGSETPQAVPSESPSASASRSASEAPNA